MYFFTSSLMIIGCLLVDGILVKWMHGFHQLWGCIFGWCTHRAWWSVIIKKWSQRTKIKFVPIVLVCYPVWEDCKELLLCQQTYHMPWSKTYIKSNCSAGVAYESHGRNWWPCELWILSGQHFDVGTPLCFRSESQDHASRWSVLETTIIRVISKKRRQRLPRNGNGDPYLGQISR